MQFWNRKVYYIWKAPSLQTPFRMFCSKKGDDKPLYPHYPAEIEQFMKKCDRNIEEMSVYDKTVRIRNLVNNIKEQSVWQFNPDSGMKKDPRLLSLVSSIEKEYTKLNSKNTFMYLLALSYFHLDDNSEFCEKISEDILAGKLQPQSYQDCMTLLNFYAKSAFANTEVLTKLEQACSIWNSKESLHNRINEFWTFNALEYYKHSTEYINNFEEMFLSLDEDIEISLEHISKLLYCYSMINEDLNFEVLKRILQNIIRRTDIFPENTAEKMPMPDDLYHSIAVIATSLTRLNIRNEKIFSMIATRILCDSFHREVYKIKPKESILIFEAFIRAEIYNYKLLRELEGSFLRHIEDADSNTVADMLLKHQMWSRVMINWRFVERNQKVSFNSYKKYSLVFINTLLKEIQKKGVIYLDYKTLFFVLKMGNIKYLKQRANSRELFQVGLQGISVLMNHIDKIFDDPERKEIEIFLYYTELSRCILNKESDRLVKEKFLEHGFDLEKLIQRVEAVMNM
ncbi:unnamed protein product [Moneuplotes crassus]|uniref:Uncharacterized protein n=1 Tax=Euplotes crassus TaxID=5936 RepID=A0AAD1UCW8_EUPCR|nr:unnamed protein product [Moneuplotes crassus]